MAYYTRHYLKLYEVSTKTHANDLEKMRDWLYDNTEEFHYMTRIDEDNIFNIIDEDYIQWIRMEEDMKNLSLAFPEYGFELEGVGENPDDRWKRYFYQGKMQFTKCQFVYKKSELW